jgi:hypothetical protein
VLNQHLSWFRTANYVERRGLVEIRARQMGGRLHGALALKQDSNLVLLSDLIAMADGGHNWGTNGDISRVKNGPQTQWSRKYNRKRCRSQFFRMFQLVRKFLRWMPLPVKVYAPQIDTVWTCNIIPYKKLSDTW